ncbi:hypothetical protein V502_11075 [Pseudogymnoascus sp. VKM F-4520 (FW-2644)]|nr:hypothetical protein V502_11075 [Pseudogymnoascus sp. VKM F-4520 (FW-2644)]
MSPRTRSQAKSEANKASATLTGLPTETLHQIFSTFLKHQSIAPDAYFRGTQQQSDERSWHSIQCHALFSLSLVSKRLRDIAQPILYKEFVPGYSDSWKSTLYTWDGRLTSFLRTIARRPDLAALVKRIYIHSHLLKSVDGKENQDGIEQAARVVRTEKWQQLSGGELVTILIAKLPNLKHFSLQTVMNPVEGLSSSYLRALGISVLPLTTIDINLCAATNEHDYLFNLEICAGAILELATNLKTLNLHMCGGIQHRAPIPSLPNLETLRITHSRLNETDLEGLLSSCANLRTFAFETTATNINAWDCVQDFGPRGHFELKNAVKYLSRHCATLKSLHLDLRERGVAYRDSIDRAIPPSFRLRDFKALEHLFLNSEDIYGGGKKHLTAEDQLLVWFLPANIVSLHLEGNSGPRLAKGLLGLAEAASEGRFPRLKKVRCDAGQILDDNAVGSMFAAARVDFNSNSFPLSNATLPFKEIPSMRRSFSPIPMPLPEEDDADL